jgi:hypothetical protein
MNRLRSPRFFSFVAALPLTAMLACSVGDPSVEAGEEEVSASSDALVFNEGSGKSLPPQANPKLCTFEEYACQNGGTCVIGGGTPSCLCAAGWIGETCTTDVDECATGASNCAADATCTNTPGSFTCTCNAGFEGDGVTCADIDECATGASNCAADATCTNTPGSFTCACNAGFEGDGVTCAASCVGGPPAELMWDPNNTASLADATDTTMANVGTLGDVSGTLGNLCTSTSTCTPKYSSTAEGVKYLTFNGNGTSSYNGTVSFIEFSSYDFGPVITASVWLRPRGKNDLYQGRHPVFTNSTATESKPGFRALLDTRTSGGLNMMFQGRDTDTNSNGNGEELSSVTTALNAYQNDKWQLFTWVVETGTGTVTMYVDGVHIPNKLGYTPGVEGGSAIVEPNVKMVGAWRIGAFFSSPAALKGDMGRFTIWKRALSECELAADYNATKALYPNP